MDKGQVKVNKADGVDGLIQIKYSCSDSRVVLKPHQHFVIQLKPLSSPVIWQWGDNLKNCLLRVLCIAVFLLLHQYLEKGGDSLSESANQTIPPATTSLGNLSALDIINDEDLPTDPSNSSDTQEESTCKPTITRSCSFFPTSWLVFSNLKNEIQVLQMFSWLFSYIEEKWQK